VIIRGDISKRYRLCTKGHSTKVNQ